MKKLYKLSSIMLVAIFMWMFTPLFGQNACEPPTGVNVNEITTNSAQVTWDDADETTQWYVFVYATEEGSEAGWETFTTANILVLNNLLPNTYYTVHVQAYCGGEAYSDWSYGYDFVTECGTIPVSIENPYSIVFSDEDVHCWSSEEMGGNSEWYVGYNGFMFRNTQAGDSARLLSPFFDLTQMQRPYLSFYHLQDVMYNLSVYYRTGANEAWQFLDEYPNQSWETSRISLPDVDLCQISFVGTNSVGFGYEDGGVQIYTASLYEYPSCVKPQNLTANLTAANQAVLSWTNPNEVSPASWTVEVTDFNNYFEEMTVTEMSATVNGLDVNRNYYWRVKANCGENDESDWSDESSFYTSCGTFVLTPNASYQMGFENGAPCWTANAQDYYWYEREPHSGYRSAYVINGDIYTPFFDLTALEHPMLTFYQKQYRANVDTILEVYYRTSEAAEWQILARYETAHEYRIEMTALPVGICQIAFRSLMGDDFNYVWLDDITVGERGSCVMPTHLAVSHTTPNSATLSWTSNGDETQWIIRIDGVRDMEVSTNPVTIDGLQPATSYSVSVQSKCSANEVSDWMGPVTFRTECDPVTITEENILSEGFEECNDGEIPACWGKVANEYGYPYAITWSPFTGNNSFYLSVTNVNSNTLYTPLISNDLSTLQVLMDVDNYYKGELLLEVGAMENETFVPVRTFTLTEEYNYLRAELEAYSGNGNRIFIRVSAKDDDPTHMYDVYIDNIVVELIPTCYAPTYVEVLNVTQDSAIVTWHDENVSTPESWTVRFNGEEITVNTDTVVLTGLSIGTTYTVQVRANCSATDVSSWSRETSFATECGVYVVTPENPYVEDFEFYPLCWSGNSWDWAWESGYAHSGEYGMYTYSDMVSPVLDLTGLENPTLTFFHKNNGVKVYYRTRESGFWILLAEYESYNGKYDYDFVSLPNPTGTYQIKFAPYYGSSSIHLDDIWIGEAPDCMAPSYINIDNVTDSSVMVGWTANGSETSWTVRLNDTETVVTENPATITGLEPGMEYVVSVRANCSSTDFSDWSTSDDFTTDCAPVYVVTASQPYYEGFEHAFCWHTEYVVNSGTWYRYSISENAHEGNNYMYSYNYTGARGRLYSPVLDLSQLSEAQLDFYVRADVASELMSGLMVQYRTSDTTDWQMLEFYMGFDTVYTRMTLILPELSSTCQIGFLSLGSGSQQICLDDVSVFEFVPCVAPSNITVENNVVSWTGDAPSYNVKVSMNGEVVDEATVSTNSYTVDGLTEGTYAIIRVQAVCDEYNLSDWTEGDVVVSTGIDSYGLNAAVYPNPTTGVVVIEGAIVNADLAIFDMFGKQLMTEKLSSERAELNLSGLVSGVYIIRITDSSNIATVKVVKK